MKPHYVVIRDGNHKAIVNSLEKMGCEVIDLAGVGDGIPDLLVECHRELYLVEVKNPETGYGKRGLNTNQKKRATLWQKVRVYVIHTIDDCVTFVQGDRESLVYKPSLQDLPVRGK